MPPSSDQLAEAWGPYMKACVEAFGPSRCMFESNFPVDKGTTSYPVLWNAFKKIAADYSESEKTALFFETASTVYNLDVSQKHVGEGEPPTTNNGE
jgi:predicted TIM-barrel fold metal-dependent hydrolase